MTNVDTAKFEWNSKVLADDKSSYAKVLADDKSFSV
jgi:hypothetical protein